eukprot:CFRG6104T1
MPLLKGLGFVGAAVLVLSFGYVLIKAENSTALVPSGGCRKKKCGPASYEKESHNLLNLLYTLAEDQARKEGYVHRGITCNTCTVSPIRGVRYKCANCVDYDICELCESNNRHTKTHAFLKIRIPIPPLANPRSVLLPVMYPGGKYEVTAPLTMGTLWELQQCTHFDQVELEALYEQFKSLSDYDSPKGGIGRESFEHCLGPLGVERNLVTERIFVFFDADGDGIISFEELCRGMSVLCKGSHVEKVHHAFLGYDIHNNGYITKDEIRKMLKAYFFLSMELVRDVIRGLEEEMEEEGWFEMADQKTNDSSMYLNILSRKVEGDGEETGGHSHFIEANETKRQSLQFLPTNEIGGNGTAGGDGYQSINSISNFANNIRRRTSYAVTRAQQKAEKGELWPVMEAMSQDAIDELVEETFAQADIDMDDVISRDEFERQAANNTTLTAWFEALGSVF